MKEYSFKFTQLARYAPTMVAHSRAWMSKFVFGVSEYVFKDYRKTMLIKDIDLSRLMVHAQQIEEQNLKEKDRENKTAKTGSFNFT